MKRLCLVGAAFLLAVMARRAPAYPVGPPLPLEKVAELSDIVIKVKAIETKPAKDEWFTDYSGQGFGVFETTLQKISAVKGEVKEERIAFRHYDVNPKQAGFMFMPQIYHFEPGASYLVFAARSGDGAYRQLWKNHTGAEDLGVFRCADDTALAGKLSVAEAVWHELKGMQASDKEADVVYGITHMGRMSRGMGWGWGATDDFARKDALAEIAPLMKSKMRLAALAAIGCVGAESPLMQDACSPYFLAARGKNPFYARGLGLWKGKENLLGKEQIAALLAVADSGDEQVRAAAIRAMMLVKDGPAAERLRTWAADGAAPVRAAVAGLWSEKESTEANDMLALLAGDKDAGVRAAAAFAIGYGQREMLVPALEKLLDDKEEKVRAAAVASLLSMDPAATKAVMEKHLGEEKFAVIFRVALGAADPAGRRKDLADLLKHPPKENPGYVSQMPLYSAWEILMDDIEKADEEDVRTGKLDDCLDGLESPPSVGSGPYQRLYGFYWKAGMHERAAAFREKAMKEVKGYDLDEYFKRIDGRAR